jgi:hypothetical protein
LSGPVHTFEGPQQNLVFPYNEITRYGVAGRSLLSAFQNRLVIEHQGRRYHFAFRALSEGSPAEVTQILDGVYGS